MKLLPRNNLPRVFVFDIGNVVWFYQKPIKQVLKKFASLTNLPWSDFEAQYILAYKLFEIGQLDVCDWLNQINLNQNIISRAQVNQILQKTLTKEVVGRYYNLPVVNLIKILKTKKYTLGMLSNGENYLHDYIQARMFHLFDFSIVSCQVGLRKPDLPIYRQIFKHVTCLPGQIVFIDDKSENVKSAMDLGINAIHFQDNSQLLNHPLLPS